VKTGTTRQDDRVAVHPPLVDIKEANAFTIYRSNPTSTRHQHARPAHGPHGSTSVTRAGGRYGGPAIRSLALVCAVRAQVFSSMM
jgi:hypothetical protein